MGMDGIDWNGMGSFWQLEDAADSLSQTSIAQQKAATEALSRSVLTGADSPLSLFVYRLSKRLHIPRINRIRGTRGDACTSKATSTKCTSPLRTMMSTVWCRLTTLLIRILLLFSPFDYISIIILELVCKNKSSYKGVDISLEVISYHSCRPIPPHLSWLLLLFYSIWHPKLKIYYISSQSVNKYPSFSPYVSLMWVYCSAHGSVQACGWCGHGRRPDRQADRARAPRPA